MIRSAVVWRTRYEDFGANVNGTFVVSVEIKDGEKNVSTYDDDGGPIV